MSPVFSTGVTSYATNGVGAVPVFTIPASLRFTHLTVINGGAAGFFSLDGGTTLVPLPAGNSTLDGLALIPGTVLSLVRAGSTDMSAVQAYCW